MRTTETRLQALSDSGPSRFDSLLNAIPEAIVLLHPDGTIALTNGAAAELFGYSHGELVGKPSDLLLAQLPRNPQTRAPQNYLAHPASHSAGKNAELVGLRKNGSEFPLQVTMNGARTQEVEWLVATFRDLTSQKRIDADLAAAAAAADAATQELQAFSHSVSHDLRAPLRALDGFTGMLKASLGANLEKKSAHALQRIEENISKMSKLIEGLLDYSSLTWLAVTKKPVNVEEIARNVFTELTRSATSRQIKFQVNKLPTGSADPHLLRRVLVDLLSNALKFTRGRNPATIEVGCRDNGGERVYFVRDNGVGFDMEYAGRLFHVFQRLHSASDFEGTGTGLAIAQRIVQRHGGRIWAEARIDGGATFFFTLGESGYGNSA